MQNQHPADVILRSSEKESFYSWKIFLSMSSPVFSDMFTLPQPDTVNEEDVCDDEQVPVIDLEEDSRTLGHILSLCHPPSCVGTRFQLNSLPELRNVLDATEKYDMGNALRMALEELSNPSLLRDDSLGIYALACQHACHEAARLAAKHTLTLPCLVPQYVPALERIHAGHLCRLFLYREACATAVCSLAADHTWVVYTQYTSLFRCDQSETDDKLEWTAVRNPPSRKYPDGRVEHVSVHKWWMEYMKRSEYALQRWPHSDAVKDDRLVDDALHAISTLKCEGCQAFQVSQTFQSFMRIFAEKIDRCIAEVEIVLGF
ncbi:hypothetical protein JVT61DRAFT_5362 [Boletus reticuloceps]|uniref:BTB domain-containing protein n=1 Tax=Boletus reticuloceps TaxID=495285 RepID=A0A8I2Z0B7_9AGAM|nr:hypothetical protein JVT61DRAFT_5362 [Boletus reticuloceps]